MQTTLALCKPKRSKISMNNAKGLALEQRVVRLFKALGKPNVRRSVFLKDKRGNRSEIDVVFGRFWWTTYVECKNYDVKRPVPLKDVAKFKEVLQQNGIPIRRGLFITTSTFSPRAPHTGIKCIDGAELRAMERTALFRGIAWRMTRLTVIAASIGLSSVFVWDYLPEEVQTAVPNFQVKSNYLALHAYVQEQLEELQTTLSKLVKPRKPI